MLKRIALFLLVFLLSATAFSDDTTLTPARLASSTWGNHPDLEAQDRVRLFGGIFVQFKSDFTFEAELGPGQGGEYTVKGTYEIKNNKLTLYTITQDGKKPWIADLTSRPSNMRPMRSTSSLCTRPSVKTMVVTFATRRCARI